MQVQFTLTPEEAGRGLAQMQRRSRLAPVQRRRSFFPISAFGVLAATALTILEQRQPNHNSSWPAVLVVHLAFVFAMIAFIFLAVYVLMRASSLGARTYAAAIRNGRLDVELGPMTLELTERGIVSSGAHTCGEYDWEYLRGVQEVDGLLLLYVRQQQAYIVPRRAFATAEEADAFRDFALSQWQRTQTQARA